MDSDSFDDLFAEADLLQDSSLESLTYAAADLDLLHVDPDDVVPLYSLADTPSTSVTSQDDGEIETRSDSARQNAALHVVAATTSRNQPQTVGPQPEDLTVIEKIEEILKGIADALENEKPELSIAIKTRANTRNIRPHTSSKSEAQPVARERRLCFPGKTEEEAWRFTVVTRILELIYHALQSDLVLSKRDIYYRDPALFGKQAHVDRYVDDIACTFDVPRSRLNVSAVAKGLIAGAINFCRRDGSVIDAANDREGMLVPSLRDMLSVSMPNVKWILVIEKEATFRSIASSSFWSTVSTQGVIITAKGYPDIATRALLHFLSTPSPQNGFVSPPVHGLVDFDPDGLAILSVYKHGSLALAHENADLRVPQLKWLGLRHEHMLLCGDDVHESQGLLSLTPRDRAKAVKMLERNIFSNCGEVDVPAQQALQTMLMLNTKAELQLLDAKPDGMKCLLMAELCNL